MMKGVAILLMLFFHLFNLSENVELCHNIISINGTPLVQILSRVANPVAFFLILGGYGLYKVNARGDKHRWSRVAKLYLHYWIILILFLTVGHFVHPGKYPGSISDIISNFTAFNTSYNGEMWFLFPYVVLSLLAPLLFNIMDRFRAWTVVAFTVFIHLCTSFCISRYGTQYLYSNLWIYNPLLVFHLMFSFSLGALAAREHFFERIRDRVAGIRHIGIFVFGGVITFISISCVLKYNFFYAFIVLAMLSLITIPRPLRIFLIELGKNSMNMWMIHSWFCYYLFHDFIYAFKYPILIFAVLTIVSYISSRIINLMAEPIERRLVALTIIKDNKSL